MARADRAMTAAGTIWAPVLLGAGLWVFAWTYAQLPPPGQAVAAFQMGTPPASRARLGADHSGRESATEIAKPVEDPIGGVTTLDLQNNTNLADGSRIGSQDVLGEQPGIPLHVTDDWMLVTGRALPLVSSSSAGPDPSVPPGRGVATVSVFPASRKPIDRWMLGARPIVQVPTIGNKTRASDVWGVSPAFVVGRLVGPIDAGAYLNNMTSLGGTSGHGVAWGVTGGVTGGASGYVAFAIDPSGHYSVGNGWFVRRAPGVAVVELPGGAKWTLPVGAQLGRGIKLDDELPVDLLVGVYYDALQSGFGARWQLRTGVGFIF
jgi:hypothetical protein